MQAVILAGGRGTRLGTLTEAMPKPMLPVNGRPFLSYLLDALVGQEISRIILSVSYRHELIRSHFGGRYGTAALDYVVEDEPLGTGGAARFALQRASPGTVFLLNGDTLFAVPLSEMIAVRDRENADLVMALRRVRDGGRYGSVVESGGRIVGFEEKSARAEAIINGGVYLLGRRDLLDGFPAGPRSLELDMFPALLKTRRVVGLHSDATFIDIGVPDDYEKAQVLLRGDTRAGGAGAAGTGA
ncbi:MAG: nucleotidyltransferase family protein [Gammaproteobacteria bacterium]|nr:nucleotidyltransferase family protein [Gammaproteobacteria bacterium]